MQRSPTARAFTSVWHLVPYLAVSLWCACQEGRVPSDERGLDAGEGASSGDASRADETPDAGAVDGEATQSEVTDAGVRVGIPPAQHFVCPGGDVGDGAPARPSCPECNFGLWRLDAERLIVRIAAGHRGVGIFYLGELPDEPSFEFDAVEVWRGELDADGNVPRAAKIIELTWPPGRPAANLQLFKLVPVAAIDGDSVVTGHCPEVQASSRLGPAEPEGVMWQGVWWHLAEAGASCDTWCWSRDGVNPRAYEILHRAAEEDAVDGCQTVLEALGVTGTVQTGDRPDGLGLGCHAWADGSLWWVRSPAFSATAQAADARIVCGCSL